MRIRPTAGLDQVSPRAGAVEVLVQLRSEQATPAASPNSQRISGYFRFAAVPAEQLTPVPVRQPGDASLLPAISP